MAKIAGGMPSKRTGKPLGVVQAYGSLLATPAVHKVLGCPLQSVLNRRYEATLGLYHREATMRKWLKKGGWQRHTVETWSPGKKTTRAAFRALLKSKHLARRLGIGPQRITKVRVQLNMFGKFPPTELMRAWLAASGCTCVCNETWTAPPDKR